MRIGRESTRFRRPECPQRLWSAAFCDSLVERATKCDLFQEVNIISLCPCGRPWFSVSASRCWLADGRRSTPPHDDSPAPLRRRGRSQDLRGFLELVAGSLGCRRRRELRHRRDDLPQLRDPWNPLRLVPDRPRGRTRRLRLGRAQRRSQHVGRRGGLHLLLHARQPLHLPFRGSGNADPGYRRLGGLRERPGPGAWTSPWARSGGWGIPGGWEWREPWAITPFPDKDTDEKFTGSNVAIRFSRPSTEVGGEADYRPDPI